MLQAFIMYLLWKSKCTTAERNPQILQDKKAFCFPGHFYLEPNSSLSGQLQQLYPDKLSNLGYCIHQELGIPTQ